MFTHCIVGHVAYVCAIVVNYISVLVNRYELPNASTFYFVCGFALLGSWLVGGKEVISKPLFLHPPAP